LSDVLFSLLFGLFVVLLSGKLIEMGVSNSVFRVTSVVFAVVMLLVVLLSTDFSNITEYSSFTLDASSKFFGGILGFAVSWLIEEKYIKFETKGSLIFQILKVVLGVAGVLLLRTLLKLVFSEIGLLDEVGHGIRYFALVVFAGTVWPYTFTKLGKHFTKL
jgi:hypothetical protein